VDCPNCHFQIGDESEVCPFCTFVIPAKRPGAAAAFPQTPPSTAVPTEIEPIRARKQSGALLYFLAAAAIGTFVYFHLQSRPAPQPPAQAMMKTPSAPEAAARRPSPPQILETVVAQAPKPAEPPPEKPVAPAPAAFWEFEGQIYDMLTLTPIPGVEMTFYSDDGNQQTKSGKGGRYRMRLPALRAGGYRLVADHPDYADEYFDDAGADYRKMSLKQRAGLRNSSPNNLPWAAQGAASVRRDVVLFPLVPDR
jgi:hypothetical protein